MMNIIDTVLDSFFNLFRSQQVLSIEGSQIFGDYIEK